jgi:hypothetical protein
MQPSKQLATTSYSLITKVKRVELRKQHIKSWKQGNDVQSEYKDIGWFVQFDGSWEALYFGQDMPDFKEGDEVRITFTRTHT